MKSKDFLLKEHKELEECLDSLIPKTGFKFSFQQNLKLERIDCLLNLMGNPQDEFSIIHIGGTSGKGTTSSYTSRILKENNYKTGVFLSPYLQVINEMYLVDGSPVKTSDLLNAFYEIAPLFDRVADITGFGKPSYFEVKFAISLLVFKKHNVDVAVIEVGLGGMLDATNAINADVSVLVSVGLDHTEILGNTIEKIASDKTGIIKDNGTIICGFTQPSTRQIAISRALEKNARLLLINRDFSFTSCRGMMSVKVDDSCIQDIATPIYREYQAHNAACAIAACLEFLTKQGHKLSKTSLIDGLSNIELPGRSEVVQKEPLVILDGAHNPDKLNTFLSRLKDFSDTPIFVIALKDGRNVNDEVITMLGSINAKEIVVTSFQSRGIWECVDASELAEQITISCTSGAKITCIEKPIDALHYALETASNNDVIAVTGSFFLIGDVRQYWHPQAEILNMIEASQD